MTAQSQHRFERSLAHVFGVTQSDRRDTRRGITQLDYDIWQAHHALPTQSIDKITAQEIREIYRGTYWTRCECDDLPPDLDLVMFDTATAHRSAAVACAWLSQALHMDPSGVVSDDMLRAVAEQKMLHRIDDLIDEFLKIRERRERWINGPNDRYGSWAKADYLRLRPRAINQRLEEGTENEH